MNVKRNALCLTLLALMPVSFSYASGISLGAAINTSHQPYKSYDTINTALPYIDYRSDSFYFSGVQAGYYIFNANDNKVSFLASLQQNYFDPDKTSNTQLKTLDKRKRSLMAGVSWEYDSNIAIFRNTLTGDTLGNSNGIQFDTSLYRTFIMDSFALTPGVGLQFNSKKFNDYYYGVSEKESNRSGLSKYNSGSSLNPYFLLGFDYAISQNIKVFSHGRYVVLTDKIKDSPMVGRSGGLSLFSGFTYSF